MKLPCPVLLVSLFTFVGTLPAATQSLYPDDASYRTAFLARCVEAREAMAHKTWAPGDDTRVRNQLGIVKVATGIDAANGLRYLEDAVADPKPVWGCFETYAFMEGVERLGDKLPPALVEQIRDRLAASFTDDFGFTDNHMLQFHVARYLFGQRWPDGPNFADGSTPAQGSRDSAAWIRRWIESTVNRGMFEYDSPNYHHLYLLCFASLHEFSQDELMRRQAWMMMQVLLAEWATEYLEGNWVGAHSREKYNQVLHTHEHTGAATRLGRLYFGAAPLRPDLKESEAVGLAALQEFPALPLLGRIATDRTQPYILRELKPPRRGPRIHYGEPTWKYTRVASEFAVGSSWGDLTDVEQHRWDLTWLSPQDGSTCFFINPSISVKQLHRYFEDPVDKLLGFILATRPYYTDPNKWIEPSPFEDVMQQDNTVLDLYDIPPTAELQHINGFFPHLIAEKREQDGWIFCRADHIFFGVWTSVPGAWHNEGDHDRLTIVHPKTAIILEAAAAKDEKSFDAFCARLQAGRPTFDEQTLTATYTNRQGRRLQFTHRGARLVDGVAVNLADWPLFEGPWLNAQPNTGIITLQYGAERVTLDFNTATVRTESIP
ncbi:MAG: hypothetical protein KA257_05645 [Opitutaceae bacterium]|nr:hypothetical protein [Opitutaceae bacterium]MBP9913478.1 hypothetical protein [Opitutaceae bacterium]